MTPVITGFVSAAIGVALFHLLALPLPWLLGPILACLIAAWIGLPMRGIKPLNESMRVILGVAIGTTLTPAVLLGVPAMWPTLLMVTVMTTIIGLIGVPYFRRIWGYDFPTAYYASMPGGLQDMLAFGEEDGGNVRTLSLVHATRVLVIVVALPALLTFFWQADLTRPPGLPFTEVAKSEMLWMALCGLVGWRAAKAIGMFGASILGPLMVTAAATLSGLINHRPPAEAIWLAQFFIGMVIGTKYSGITTAEIKRDLVAALGFCVILMLLTLAFVELALLADLAPGLEALLSFAPGGQAELAVMALIVGADAAFVVTHHIFRIFLVIMGAPIAKRLWSAETRPPGS